MSLYQVQALYWLVNCRETDMDENKEPQKENVWLVAAAGGAMLVCCLAPVLFVSGAAWFTGWFSGIDPLGALAIAVAVGGAVLMLRRRRQAAARDERPSSTTQAIGEDR